MGYSVKVEDAVPKVGQEEHRMVAFVRHPSFEGARYAVAGVHPNALKSWGTDQLVNLISDRLYDNYIENFGEIEE